MKQYKQIPLNLIFDYPVHWSKYKVLRDFIQNFYDSLSYKEFENRFIYNLSEDGVLTCTAKNTCFNYEWLVHIGASSKREESDKYAGYFGEGFKIASLCAIRDYNWNISMSSSNWSLDVTTLDMKIDDKSMTSLAYNLFESDEIEQHTTLKIYPFSKSDYEIFLSSLYTFYYSENPLFSEKLYENEFCAVYYRSNLSKPAEFPISYDSKGDGIVFGSYQALGSFEFPLVFCLHTYKQEDRDRDVFSKIDIINILVGVTRQVPSSIAYILLNCFKKYWYTYPSEKYGYKSYYSVIKTLVMKLYMDNKITKDFIDNNPNLLAASKLSDKNLRTKNMRKQALSWLKLQTTNYILVQDNFRILGYPTLEAECEKFNGFTLLRNPNILENKYLKVLEDCTQQLFTGFLETSPLPLCKIITNNDASWAGMAECIKLTNPKYNNKGFKIRNELRSICLKLNLFEHNSFDDALSTYLHELAHIFGSDNSVDFSKALTTIISKIIDNIDIIYKYKDQWKDTI